MTTLMTRDEIAQAAQDHMEQHHGVMLAASEWDALADTILRALEVAGYQIVQGEPVALLMQHKDQPDTLDFYRYGTMSLTQADRDAGWTETYLYAGKVQP